MDDEMTAAPRRSVVGALVDGVRTYRDRRRWLDRRIAELDPETDYAEIFPLSTVFAANDFQMHWFYAVNSPAAGTAPAVMDAVWRAGTGTYGAQPKKRLDDSLDHMMVWFEHGPDSPATRKSVEMVNRYHAHFARDYPDGFADIDDYVYILCLNATGVNSAIRSLGLPGFTEGQERAAYLFWSKVADQFLRVVDDRPVTEVVPFPADYDGMVECVREYEARPWPLHEPGRAATASVVEFFATTWFPRPLHPVGRALVTAFLSPTVRRVHSVPEPPAALRLLVRATMKAMILVGTHLVPDPVESLPDRRRRLAAARQGPRSAVDVAVHRSLGTADGRGVPTLSACPHLAATR